jgi:hypothetical protein
MVVLMSAAIAGHLGTIPRYRGTILYSLSKFIPPPCTSETT